MKILFLAANPQSTSRLNLEREAREIQEALDISELSPEFELIQKWEVRPKDFRRALLKYTPDIVHFSGHGKGESGLIISDEAGTAKAVTGDALAGLFAEFDCVKCVLLNACYAEVQAQAIVRQVNYVIGMRDTIYDKAAIAFSVGFYDGLGYGKTIEEAFNLGSNAILWEYEHNSGKTRELIPVDSAQVKSRGNLPEHLKPILLKKGSNVTPEIVPQAPINEPVAINSNPQQKYRARIKKYLGDRNLTPITKYQLAIFAQQQGISELEANDILQAELDKNENLADNNQKPNSQKFPFEVITVNERGEENSRTTKEAEFFSEDLGNGVTLDMVKIPRGEFTMGSPAGEGLGDEKPQHQVKVQSFWMGKYPVTQKQWSKVAKLPQVNCNLNPDPSNFKGAHRPVERINWDEAVEFCDRLSQVTNKQYRLPSEAEWEYACRAGTYTRFHFGLNLTPKLARCSANIGEIFLSTVLSTVGIGDNTSEVGQFFPNSFGLYDMHGNVWEWCADDWHSNYDGAPQDSNPWLSGNYGTKVIRGGSWDFIPDGCRSGLRGSLMRGHRGYSLGFRVVVAPKTT